ncbi:MAG: hypothetical protein JST26_17580 [Bacteroidetes bacterium]|nr:hypothetical protein [Bacteroidota bacterium]
MKAFISFIFLCFTYVTGFSQTPFLIEEEFNAGTAPSGWTFTSIGSNSTLQNCGKSPNSIVFNATNDQVVSPTFSGGDQLTFLMICSSTPNTTDKMKVEGLNGSWSTIANIKPHTTAVISCIGIPSGVTQIRLTYTMGAATNVYVDDFTVRQSGNCSASGNKPYITTINADACSSGCEGHDEFFTIKNGNSAWNISDIEFSYPNAGTSTSTWCGSNTTPCDKFIATNSSEVAALNTLAGCSVFISPGTSIPANADILIFNGNPQQQRTNFSGLCSTGKTYYALFANNTNTSSSDGCNGRFGNRNTGCSDCYRGLFLRNRASGCTDTVSYQVDQINGNDGAMALYASQGSPANYTSSGASTCAFIALPVRITTFYASAETTGNVLYWETMDDETIARYTVEKSDNGTEFAEIGEVLSKRANNKSAYSYTDADGGNSSAYYRLKSTDADGNEIYSQVVFAIRTQADNMVITQDQTEIHITTGARDAQLQTLEVYTGMGTKILEAKFTGMSFSIPKAGFDKQLYFFVYRAGGNPIIKKLFVE